MFKNSIKDILKSNLFRDYYGYIMSYVMNIVVEV